MNNFYTEIKEEKNTLSFIVTKNGIAESKYTSGRIVDEESAESSGDIIKSRDQADIESLRRSIIIEGSNIQNALNLASQFCFIQKEKMINSLIYASPERSKFVFIELKENENQSEILNKFAPIKAAANVTFQQKPAEQKIKVEGDSINQCLDIISKKLKCDKEKIKYKIIKQGGGGFLGIGKSKFVVEAQL